MNAPHLDDDALSAALDAAPSSQSEQAHLNSCPTCQARREQFAAVAGAVGAPVPRRPADEVDAAVQQALGPSGSRAPVPLVAVPTRPRPTSRRSRRWVEAAAGIAAAALLVGGVAALVRGGSSSRKSATSSAGPASVPASTVAPGPTSTAASGPTAAEAGDLGEQSDPSQLARLITGRFAAQPPSSSTAGPAQPSPGAETSCIGRALVAAGLPGNQEGELRFVAPLHWRGQPAVVFVFDRSAPPGGRAGVVMRTTDCAFLTALPL
ncbi:MAG TPA: hypothetical protein VLL25_17560 [Acidimicrobiales bacterium]|nr:hypothetical protein [Acidimicrobiales bacterium]